MTKKNIYGIEIGKNTIEVIANEIKQNTDPQIYPSISGHRVVWQDNRNGNWDIYMYDLSTHTETQITNDPNYQGSPDISGDRIVWMDNRNGNYDIYMWDLRAPAGSELIQITTDPKGQQDPSISGDRIVWSDYRNGSVDIYMYDLSTHTETAISAVPFTQRWILLSLYHRS